MLGFLPLSTAPLSAIGFAAALAGDAGAYAVTGQDAALNTARTVTAEAGAYALTGKDAELDPSLFFRCQTGDYYVIGQDATLTATLRVVADAGSYAVTGQDAPLRFGGRTSGEAGAYTVTGQDARARFVLTADAAQYVNPSTDGPMSSLPMSSLGETQPVEMPGYPLIGYGVLFHVRRMAEAGAYTYTGYFARLIKGPVIRARGRDLSMALVLVRDFSEGLP